DSTHSLNNLLLSLVSSTTSTASAIRIHFTSQSPSQPSSPPFPYTTLFRSGFAAPTSESGTPQTAGRRTGRWPSQRGYYVGWAIRSEEHTSELQSRRDLVCRLLLEKKIYRYF